MLATPEDARHLARKLNRPVRLAPVELFRIAAGLLAFGYFTRCAWEADLYAAPDGLLDHALSESFNWFTYQPLFRPEHPAWWPRAVFVAAMALSLLLAAGARARWCAAALYLVAVCAYRWNFLVLYVDDAVIHLILFWLILLPEGSRFTWRALLRRADECTPHAELGPGAVLRLCCANVALLYAVAGTTKWLSPMWRDGTALYAILRHPIGWAPALWTERHMPVLSLLGWASMLLEPALPLLVFLPRHHWLKYVLLAGALALHLGISLTLDLAFANIGCLVLAILVFHEEIADALDRGATRVAPPTAPWTWREHVAGLAFGLLVVAMGCSALQAQWRQVAHARAQTTAHLLTAETGGTLQSAAFAGLWCLGLAQQYRLLDWIDERDVHVLDARVEETTPAGERRSLPYDALVPVSTRSVLLISYLTGFTWSPLPLRDLRRLRPVLARRMAEHYCRRRDQPANVRAEFAIDRTSRASDPPVRVVLAFRCAAGVAGDVALSTHGIPTP